MARGGADSLPCWGDNWLMAEYRTFHELAAAERTGLDYVVRLRLLPGTPAILAPHGGGIEPGTSEIADAVAGSDYSFYALEGVKSNGNGRLHITSTCFDEPQCLALLEQARWALAIHGERTDAASVFVGGRNAALRERFMDALAHAGFPVQVHTDPGLQGVDPINVCNRAGASGGVQLELSAGFRRLLFEDLSAYGRKCGKPAFEVFVAAVREVLAREETCAAPMG